MITRITPSEAERGASAFSSATLNRASHCLRAEGALILEDIVNPALIFEAREVFLQKYYRYLDGREHDDALEVGERRPMITVGLESPFDRRELLANSWLCPVLNAAFEGISFWVHMAWFAHYRGRRGNTFTRMGATSSLTLR